MLNKIIKVRELVKNILSKRNYLILFICSSALLFFVFYILTLATVTNQSPGIFIMMNGFWYTIATFFLLALIAMLFGAYAVILAYSIRLKLRHKKKASKSHGIFGGAGFLTGLFSAGCPMCGAFLFGLFGAPLTLFFMPFKGLELRMLALALLSMSVYLIGKSLSECKIRGKGRKNL